MSSEPSIGQRKLAETSESTKAAEAATKEAAAKEAATMTETPPNETEVGQLQLRGKEEASEMLSARLERCLIQNGFDTDRFLVHLTF